MCGGTTDARPGVSNVGLVVADVGDVAGAGRDVGGWCKEYFWQVDVSNGVTSSGWTGPSCFTPTVPQPPVTSHLAGAAEGAEMPGVNPQVGNYRHDGHGCERVGGGAGVGGDADLQLAGSALRRRVRGGLVHAVGPEVVHGQRRVRATWWSRWRRAGRSGSGRTRTGQLRAAGGAEPDPGVRRGGVWTLRDPSGLPAGV